MPESATATDTVISARGLVRRYGDFTAVDGIDFDIRRRECFGFLGPNGAGKTTTMRMIYRASPVTDGSLTILGHEAAGGANDRAIKGRIGVVPQENNLDWDLTVRENLSTFARFYGLSGAAARERVDELMEFFGLADRADGMKVRLLSGGQQQRIMIARGLLGNPDVVVLDEPTTGLDPQARQDLWERLFELKRRDVTLVLTTHYMDEAEQLCDRLVIMDGGKIVAEGTPRELISAHVTGHVVEVHIDGTAEPPPAADALRAAADRSELLRHRLLLYTNDGEALIAKAAHALPDCEALLRRSTLEDVFLQLTGRSLTG